MKKLIALLLSIVLVISVLAAFTGCSIGKKDDDEDDEKKEEKKDEEGEGEGEKEDEVETIVGKWECEFESSEIIKQQVAAEDEQMASCFDFSKLAPLSIVMEFKADGTYKTTGNADALLASLPAVFKEGVVKYLEAMLGDALGGKSVEEYCTENGMDLNEVIEGAMSEFDMDSISKSFDAEGKYKAENGKLYTTDSLDAEIDESVYEEYELKGTKLTIKEEGIELVFNKVK